MSKNIVKLVFTRLPEDTAPEKCDICDRDLGECRCPVCPTCHKTGDPNCIKNGHAPLEFWRKHGLNVKIIFRLV